MIFKEGKMPKGARQAYCSKVLRVWLARELRETNTISNKEVKKKQKGDNHKNQRHNQLR